MLKYPLLILWPTFFSWYDSVIKDLFSGLPDKILSLHTRWILKHQQKGILCMGLFAELPRYKFQASKPTHLKRLPTQVLVFSNVFLNNIVNVLVGLSRYDLPSRLHKQSSSTIDSEMLFESMQ